MEQGDRTLLDRIERYLDAVWPHFPPSGNVGVGAAVTAALVADARQRGVDLILLSAGSDEIARVYATVGFVRVGTFCQARRTSSAHPVAG